MATPILQIDAFSKLSELVREELLGRAKGQPAPERLKIILKGICDFQSSLDPRIATRFGEIVYVVLNHPPLRSQRQERHFVAAMNLSKLDSQTAQHLRGMTGHQSSAVLDSACELLFFGPSSEVQLQQAAASLWHRKWLEYWRITIDWEQKHLWYTWNQLLLKGVRPVPIGLCWQSPAPARDQSASNAEPQPPYLYLSSELSARIGLPDPHPSIWFEQLLKPISSYAQSRTDYPLYDADLYPLREIFNHIDPKGFRQTTDSVAWAVAQLARHYACWGGQAFISIPVVIGALGLYRVAVLSVCTNQPLEPLAYREWKLIAGAVFRPLIEEEMATLVRTREMTKLTYSIGHSLKSRYRGMTNKLADLCEKVSKELQRNADAQAAASIAIEHSESCQRTAEMMNLTAALLHAEDGSALRGDFFSQDSYPIEQILRKQCTVCNAAQKRTVLTFDEGDLRKILKSKATITPSGKSNALGRLFDPFYDEVIFEILLNAAQHSFNGSNTTCILKLGLDNVEYPQHSHHLCSALVFTNPCCDADILQTQKGFALGVWLDCQEAHEGGLRFMAECLHLTTVGKLEARFLKRGPAYLFQTRLTLAELTKNHE